MMTPGIRHRVERTRNRHSRAVLQGDTVVIRLARGLSATEERRHIESLLRRMRTAVARERMKMPVDPFRAILEGASTALVPLTSGRSCRFSLRPGRRTKAEPAADGWIVDVAPRTDRRRLHRFLWLLLCDREREWTERLLRDINAETLRVRVRTVNVRYAQTQWGSCSARGDISLNPALLLLPERLLRYVCIHELAHRIVRGHSRAYWRIVASAFPEHREARRELLTFRIARL